MPSVTLYADKDARIAQSGSTNLGAGASKRSPYGLYSGYKYRALIDFGNLPAGITSITKATLYTRTSDEYYVAFGSVPRCYIERITESWSEGTSDGMSTSNAVTWANQPSVSATNRVMYTPTATQNAWDSALITLLMRDVLAAGSTFYGLRLGNYNEASGSNVGEIWTTEQGTSYRPYIVVEYETNTAPNAPTLTSPGNGSKVTDATPTLAFTGSDPDAGDSISKYHVQVSIVSNFASTVWDADDQTSGISGMTVSRAYAGTALTRGGTYYWRAATYDADGVKGAFSAYRTFKYNSLPTCAFKFSGSWAAGPSNLNSTTESIASLLKVPLTFTPTDPDGDSITGYELEIAGGLAATYTVSGTFASGTAITYTPAANFVNGTAYTYRVRAKDSEGVYGAWTATQQFRPRMSQTIYEFNVGAGNIPTVKTGTKTAALQLLYRIAGASGASPTAWATSPPAPTASKPYLNVMVRMAVISGISGDVDQPTLSSLTVTWSSTDTTPYNWSNFTSVNTDGSKIWQLDRSGNSNRYGINSVRGTISTTGSNASIYQDIDGLQPFTEYSFGAWVKVDALQSNTGGNPGAGVRIFPYGLGTGQIAVTALILSTDPRIGDGQWYRLVGRFVTGDYTGVRMYLHVQQSGGIIAEVSWDAAMLSEGPVLPAWTPALAGTPVIIDANGLYINNAAGGIFRQTNAGVSGTRGVVELTNTGMRVENGEIRVLGAGSSVLLADPDPTRTGQFMFQIAQNDGKLSWGPGAGATRDVNLYRGGANLLKTDDDFEVPLTGTATPTITGGGTATLTNALTEWVKIGRMVTFRCTFTILAAGSGSTAVAVTTGLPAAPGTNRQMGDRGTTGVEPIIARMGPTGNFTSLSTAVAAATLLTGANLVANAIYQFTGSYISTT